MLDEKLKNLQRFLQDASDTAFEYSQLCSKHTTMPVSFDTHFESVLSARSIELSFFLNDIAQEQAKKIKLPPKIDFEKFIKYSSIYPDHKEVFVGDKWVLVPNETSVNFKMTSTDNSFSFSVTLKYGNNTASFSNIETNNNHQLQNRILGEKLNIEKVNTVPENTYFDYKTFGENVFDKTKSSISFVNDNNSLFKEIPNTVKRHYAYKISKTTKLAGKELKAGKIFQTTKKLSKSLEVLGPIGDVLTIGNIAYEVKEDTWDAHTAVDGVLLVVGVVASVAAAPEIIVGLAIYGILDYAFDISEKIDDSIGRKSDIWKDKPIYHYNRDNQPLFNKKEIDNTYVAPKKIIKPNFKL